MTGVICGPGSRRWVDWVGPDFGSAVTSGETGATSMAGLGESVAGGGGRTFASPVPAAGEGARGDSCISATAADAGTLAGAATGPYEGLGTELSGSSAGTLGDDAWGDKMLPSLLVGRAGKGGVLGRVPGATAGAATPLSSSRPATAAAGDNRLSKLEAWDKEGRSRVDSKSSTSAGPMEAALALTRDGTGFNTGAVQPRSRKNVHGAAGSMSASVSAFDTIPRA